MAESSNLPDDPAPTPYSEDILDDAVSTIEVADTYLDSEDYLPEPEDTRYLMEVPTSPEPYFLKPPLPNAMSPMATVEAEGEMYRGLGNPHTPLWVTLASWPILGLPALVTLGITTTQTVEMVHTARTTGFKSTEDAGAVFIPTAALLLASFLSVTLLVVLFKGTLVKLRARPR